MKKIKFVAICVILVIFCMCVEEESYTPKTTSSPKTTQPEQTTTQAPQTTAPSREVSVGPYDKILVCTWGSPKFYNKFMEMLRGKGYSVHTLHPDTKITADLLSEYGILIILWRNLSSEDVSLLEQWINSGGSILITSNAQRCQGINELLIPFKIQINDESIKDPVNTEGAWHYTKNLEEHYITKDVDKVLYGIYSYETTSVKLLSGSDFKIIIRGEESAYSEYYTHCPPLVAVYSEGLGRIIVSIDYALCTSGFFDENILFSYQMIQWLARKD